MIVSENRINENLGKYETTDESLISSKQLIRNFGLPEDYVEAHIYTSTNVLISSDNNFTGYNIPGKLKGEEVTTTNQLEFSASELLISSGYVAGSYKVTYNIFRKKVFDTNEKVFFIKEISADRTELRISTNLISNNDVQYGVGNLINEMQTAPYFKDFLLNFGNNDLIDCVNIALDTNTDPYSILVKLYKPLPVNFSEKDSFWFVEELSSPITFEVELFPEILELPPPKIKGPNFNIEVDQHANTNSEYLNENTLLSNNSVFSYREVLNKLSESGIQISVDYSDYSDFIHFSSAKRRLLNFIYKIQLIEQYNSSISILQNIPNYQNSTNSSQSIYDYRNKIDSIVTNFDGYENYLYYESASTSWPKSGSAKPYYIYPSTSSQALYWIGSLDYTSPYYGGQISTASYYDDDNQDGLVKSIPEYLRLDDNNRLYEKFIDMIGQHFDNVWLYIKSITDLYKNRNNLNKGISKDLVYHALRSLGIKLYNSRSNDDLYSYLIGATVSGSYSLVSDNHSTLISASSDIVPGQDLQKELLKRIYHNLPQLLKKKGTDDGIADLISVFGIPDTILSTNEFGGSDKNNETVEYTYDRFSYSLSSSYNVEIQTRWDYIYYSQDPNGNYVPDSVELRFKPVKSSYYNTSSILECTTFSTNPNRLFGVVMSPDKTLGFPYSKIEFCLSGSYGYNSCSISLPIYHTGSTGETSWWNLMITRDTSRNYASINLPETYTLIAANKIGDRIGHQASASMYVSGTISSSYNNSWASPSHVFNLGASGLADNRNFKQNGYFLGDFQELRFWGEPLSLSKFLVHTLNPESIEGNTSGSSWNYLAARFPLGNDLVTYNHFINYEAVSIHRNGNAVIFTNYPTYNFLYFNNFPNNNSYNPNYEKYITNSPNSVYSNPVNKKVRIVDNYITGSVLSPFLRLEDNSLNYRTKDIHFLDVSFSPQNEVNKDIIAEYGNTIDLDELLGNPSHAHMTKYPDLNNLNQAYYLKYLRNYNLKDYVRLIQFFDNTLFKMIMDYVPGRDNLNTGITIKSPILERPKAKTPIGKGEDHHNDYSTEITGSKPEGDSIYTSGYGDGSDFYLGELSGSFIDVNATFIRKNRNHYLWP